MLVSLGRFKLEDFFLKSVNSSEPQALKMIFWHRLDPVGEFALCHAYGGSIASY